MEFFKKYQGPIIGVAVAIVVIIIGIVVMNPKKDTGSTNETTNATSTTNGTASMFEAVSVGQFEYKLAGVDFTFTPENGKTQVRIKLDGLTRNSVPIDVATYRLGSYSGVCAPMDQPQGLVIAQGSRPLAYAQCEAGDATTQFMVAQEGNNIVTHTRILTQESETSFDQIQSIDLSTIVK